MRILLPIFSLLLDLVTLFSDVPVRGLGANDFVLDLHGPLLLLSRDARHVELCRVEIVRVGRTLARELVEGLAGAALVVFKRT